MRRKIFNTIFCLLLLLNFAFCAYAAAANANVIDEADLFTDQEHIALEGKADSLTQEYGMDVFIVTIKSLDGETAQKYAESLYTYGGRHWWDSEHTILFLLAMEEREWYISTGGNAIYAFTDYGLDQLGKAIVPYLSDGAYAEGFHIYLDMLPMYFDAYAEESPIDGYVDPATRYPGEVVYYQSEKSGFDIFWISLVIGVAAASIVILIMRHSMNTKRSQHSAGDYLTNGSFRLHTHRDIYLYSNISKVRRQQNTGSGGSSVHRSSGGRSHGGRGGKF